MSRNAFGRLCLQLENVGGLSNTNNVQVSEQVAIFLTILAHHKKNRVLQTNFKRSGYTISTHFNNVLTTLLKLHTLFLVKPGPIGEDCTNDRWKWFKSCLGALDGTYIPLRVALKDKPRYRNRNGDVSVNVLAVCDININYVYLLCGWEGSAADSKVLKDVITRKNGFRFPDGNYHLCDTGYRNGDGFLAPYRSGRYHIQEWNSQMSPPPPRKMRMSYSIRDALDPLEAEIPEVNDEISDDPDIAFIDQVEPSQQWTNWRENLATNMMNRKNGVAPNECIPKTCRRGWTVEGEKVLANAMKALVVNGYKADNGFKSGLLFMIVLASASFSN
ncbi:hypothetical protein BUALT_Bualt13G0061700 [Buddleja alternifolia]|uniref:DDE Tnp4 domain-containing protein n=1 Tax=Buddleja alternifolia TaxID=168488 RepID=A0AAV6WTN9_9LAMI|nr:hypothetical protein BUALT_Bualt13G0061700 [Buddleja alternifolia]